MEAVTETKALLDRFDEVSARFGEPLDDDAMNELMAEQAELQEKIDACNGWELQRTLDIAMDALRCPPGDADVATLSGGERRRVALCRLLLSQPDLLLLDEPTNHLDAESVAWLERFLQGLQGHRRRHHPRPLLPRQCGRAGSSSSIAAAASPTRATTRAGSSRRESGSSRRSARTSPASAPSASEQEWISQSPRARQAKQKARITAYEELLAQAAERAPGSAQIIIPAGPRLGDLVIEATDVKKAFGDRLLIDDLSFRLPPGGIVGVIGPNGAGKTTLFRMIIGEEKPDTGSFRLGDTVKLGYVDQSRDSLERDKNVWEEISEGKELIELGKYSTNSRAYVSAFNFRGPDQQKKVGTLSGGERNRVHLAKLLKSGANVILLDEPTNDLDVDTLRALEEALLEFAGCAVVISHDRWFLDRIATHILAFEGDSQVVWFEGNYQDYEADRHRRLGTAADQPHRIKYKPLKAA